MRKIAVFVGGDLSSAYTNNRFDLYVGVDRACLFLLDNELSLDWAVGDFDSVTSDEFNLISDAAGQIFQSPSEKDDTDTELALKLIFDSYPEAEVSVFGAFGRRIDHQLANLFLPSNPILYPFMSQIHLIDVQNDISFKPHGKHRISPQAGKTYISFLVEGSGELEILGAKYELTKENFFTKKIYASNEFVDGEITINLTEGYVVIMQTKDRS